MKIVDDFSDEREAGYTLGTHSSSGALRLGVDRERLIAIDHGALRFQPLLRDGWGRQGLSYGPVNAEHGFAFAVGILNGHNTSQAGHLEQPFAARLRTWLRAGGIERGRERAVAFVRYGRHRATLRQFGRWLARAPRIYRAGPLDENLAVGLYDMAAPDAPQGGDVGFVMHAAGPENGELWARVAGRSVPVLRSVQNVPLLLVIAWHERSATYYVASSEPARGAGRLPAMRPLAVTPHDGARSLFPGVHQSALGQVGFRVDTRVYGVRVEPWAEDTRALLLGDSLTSSDAALQGMPRALDGFERQERGLCALVPGALAWCALREAAGLVHVLVEEGGAPALLFGDEDAGSAFAVELARGTVRLSQRVQGEPRLVAEAKCDELALGEVHSLQLLQEEDAVTVCLDGRLLFEGLIRLRALRGVGFHSEQPSSAHLCHLEVHPRELPVPSGLHVPLPSVAQGRGTVIDEPFSGPAGDLDGREVKPGATWRKELGAARIVLSEAGGGALVTGARELMTQSRTVYTLPWRDPRFADLSVQVKPPGQKRGDGEEGRAGLVFWQDPDNYVIVGTWLHDHYGGASISSFYRLRGFEDVYDAVWTNVGERVQWGVPYELRVAFDGRRFTALVDGEAVLQRALSDVRPDVERLAVLRVGIVANWEWGTDTGSAFRRFVAREQAPGVELAPWVREPRLDQTVA